MKIKFITILCAPYFDHYTIKDANLEAGLTHSNKGHLVDFEPNDNDSTIFEHAKIFAYVLFYNEITDSVVFEKIANKLLEVKESFPIDGSIQSRLWCIVAYSDDTAEYINFSYDSMLIKGNAMEPDKEILKLLFPYMPESFRKTYIMYFELEND